MRPLLFSAVVTTVLLLSPLVPAASDTPVGTWRTIDDDTGQPKALVEISENHGVLEGKVIKVLQSDQGPHPVCTECEGQRHNQPVEGMTIIWGLERDGDEWTGGHILDPNNGKTYKAKMSLGDGGQTLDVRGYIGFSLFGRTQTWQRVDSPAPTTSSAAAAPSQAPAPAPATSVMRTPVQQPAPAAPSSMERTPTDEV